jgi:dolichol kinase
MDLIQDLILMLITYAYVFLTILIPVYLKKKNKVSKFTARKMVHLLAGLSVLTTPFFTWPYFAVVIAGSLTALTLLSSKESKVKKLKELYDSIGEEAEEKVGFLQGPFHYCVSITVLVTIFVIFAPHQLYFPIAGILIMIIADTLASVVGKRFGRNHIKFPWTSRRTVEGSFTMFIISFLLALGSFFYFGMFNPVTQQVLTWDKVLVYALIIGIMATVIELISPSTWDDLTVPMGTTAIIYLLTLI